MENYNYKNLFIFEKEFAKADFYRSQGKKSYLITNTISYFLYLQATSIEYFFLR